MPLTRELIPPTPMRMVAGSSHPRTTSTITRPVPSLTSTQAWDFSASNLQGTEGPRWQSGNTLASHL